MPLLLRIRLSLHDSPLKCETAALVVLQPRRPCLVELRQMRLLSF
jgi:hypothetical protein